MCGVTMLLVEHKVWSKTKVIQDDSMQNERTVLVIQCNCWVENESMYIVLTTATLELVDCPSVPLFRLLNRWRASCASAVFAKLVPPRSSEDSKSNTVNGCAESTNEQVIKRRDHLLCFLSSMCSIYAKILLAPFPINCIHLTLLYP